MPLIIRYPPIGPEHPCISIACRAMMEHELTKPRVHRILVEIARNHTCISFERGDNLGVHIDGDRSSEMRIRLGDDSLHNGDLFIITVIENLLVHYMANAPVP